MLHILLTILKIIGIILLAILGIIILLLCVVFFVPLRYELTAETKGNLKDTRLEVTFHWLLRLLSGRIIYSEEKMDCKIKVLWINISEEELSDNKTLKEEPKEETEQIDPDKIVKKVLEKTDPDKIVDNILEHKEDISDEKTSDNKLDKLKYTIRKVCDTIKMVLEFLKDEAHIGALKRIKRELIRLLVSLKPKKLKGKVRFGMEDPCQTGQILAAASVLYPVYGENIEIHPEFDKKMLEGDVYLKGHIRVFYAVRMAISMILDKNVRNSIKDVMTLFKNN